MTHAAKDEIGEGLNALDVEAAMGLIYGYGDASTKDWLRHHAMQCKEYPHLKQCEQLLEWNKTEGETWTPEGALKRARAWMKARGVDVDKTSS